MVGVVELRGALNSNLGGFVVPDRTCYICAPSPPWRNPLMPSFASERMCKPEESFHLEQALQIVNVSSDYHSLISHLR